jgi:hypothetical protein
VYAGTVDQSKFAAEGAYYQAIRVANYSVHPKYYFPKNDLAMLLLSRPLTFNGDSNSKLTKYNEIFKFSALV